MKRLLLLSILFVLATACGHKDKGFIPERLLSEQEMVDIITDVQIIEADINYQKSMERDQEEDSVEFVPKDYLSISRDYYNQLFEHYGITDSIFEQNLRYYAEHPAVLEKIMDSVMQRLTKEQAISSTQ